MGLQLCPDICAFTHQFEEQIMAKSTVKTQMNYIGMILTGTALTALLAMSDVWQSISPQLWTLINGGFVGYVALRSGEKALGFGIAGHRAAVFVTGTALISLLVSCSG